MDARWVDILGRTLGMTERSAGAATMGWWLDINKRNQFRVAPDAPTVAGILEMMTAAGLMRRGHLVNEDRYYHATRKGIYVARMEFMDRHEGVTS